MSYKDVFKMPKPVKIIGRTSTITNAFVNGIIPVIVPTQDEIEEALSILGMTDKTICCAYCGDAYTEWDHLRPLIKDKKATGYVSEIHNLIPACGKCNQSKGNKEWKTWMYSNAKLSPFSRKIPDLDDRCAKIEEYEKQKNDLNTKLNDVNSGIDKINANYKNIIESLKNNNLPADQRKQLEQTKSSLEQQLNELNKNKNELESGIKSIESGISTALPGLLQRSQF